MVVDDEVCGSNNNNNVSCSEMEYLQVTLDQLEVQSLNFGARFIKDSRVRFHYSLNNRSFSNYIIEQVKSGQLSPKQGQMAAHAIRNQMIILSRSNSSDIGLAYAEAKKPSSKLPTLEYFQEKYSHQKFKKAFKFLSDKQREDVFLEIVGSGGRANSTITNVAKFLGPFGRVLAVLTAVLATYDIYEAENKEMEVKRQAVLIGGGAAGGMAGGALAGLACGPGAPVCVTIGVIMGGGASTLSADYAFRKIFNYYGP